MHAGVTEGQERASDPLEMEVQVVGHPSPLWASASAVRSLDHPAISPGPRQALNMP